MRCGGRSGRPGSDCGVRGTQYYFCSRGCKETFEHDPEQFLESSIPTLVEEDGVSTPRVAELQSIGTFELDLQNENRLAVGDEVRYIKTVTDDDVRTFAGGTGDTNALHLNERFASETRFGGRIVHGTLLAGHISAALASLPGITTYLSQTLEFHSPVEIGATVVTTCRIVEQIDDDRYCLTTQVENSKEELVIHGTANVLIDELPLTSA